MERLGHCHCCVQTYVCKTRGNKRIKIILHFLFLPPVGHYMFWEASSFKPLPKQCLCTHVFWEQILLSDLFIYIYICYLNNTQQLFSVPCNNDSFKCVVISYCLEAPSVEGWIFNTQYSRTHLLRPLQKWGKGVNHFPAKLMMLMQLNKNKTKKVPHRGFQPKTRNNVYLLQFAFPEFAWKVTICAGHYMMPHRQIENISLKDVLWSEF